VESATEVRYAGVVVGRAAQVRDVDDTGAFVVFAEPLPVGTLVAFKVGEDERRARVSEVVESANEAVAGMRVAFVGVTAAAAPPELASQAVPPAPKPMAAATAAPVPQPAAEPARPAAPAPADIAPASPVAVATPEGSGSAASPVPVATAEGSGAVASGAVSAGHASHDGDGGGRRRRRRR